MSQNDKESSKNESKNKKKSTCCTREVEPELPWKMFFQSMNRDFATDEYTVLLIRCRLGGASQSVSLCRKECHNETSYKSPHPVSGVADPVQRIKLLKNSPNNKDRHTPGVVRVSVRVRVRVGI